MGGTTADRFVYQNPQYAEDLLEPQLQKAATKTINELPFAEPNPSSLSFKNPETLSFANEGNPKTLEFANPVADFVTENLGTLGVIVGVGTATAGYFAINSPKEVQTEVPANFSGGQGTGVAYTVQGTLAWPHMANYVTPITAYHDFFFEYAEGPISGVEGTIFEGYARAKVIARDGTKYWIPPYGNVIWAGPISVSNVIIRRKDGQTDNSGSPSWAKPQILNNPSKASSSSPSTHEQIANATSPSKSNPVQATQTATQTSTKTATQTTPTSDQLTGSPVSPTTNAKNPYPTANPDNDPIFDNPTTNPTTNTSNGIDPTTSTETETETSAKPTTDPSDVGRTGTSTETETNTKTQTDTPISIPTQNYTDTCLAIKECSKSLKDAVEDEGSNVSASSSEIKSVLCEKDDKDERIENKYSYQGSKFKRLENQINAIAKVLLDIQDMICEKSDPVVGVPEWWPYRVGSDRPQLIVYYALLENGKINAKSIWHTTIAHFNPDKKSVLFNNQPPVYTRGNTQILYTLSDNSKFIMNCQNDQECKKNWDFWSQYINQGMIRTIKDGKIGARNGKIKEQQVKAIYADFYSKGQTSENSMLTPDWRAYWNEK